MPVSAEGCPSGAGAGSGQQRPTPATNIAPRPGCRSRCRSKARLTDKRSGCIHRLYRSSTIGVPARLRQSCPADWSVTAVPLRRGRPLVPTGAGSPRSPASLPAWRRSVWATPSPAYWRRRARTCQGARSNSGGHRATHRLAVRTAAQCLVCHPRRDRRRERFPLRKSPLRRHGSCNAVAVPAGSPRLPRRPSSTRDSHLGRSTDLPPRAHSAPTPGRRLHRRPRTHPSAGGAPRPVHRKGSARTPTSSPPVARQDFWQGRLVSP